MPHTHSQRMEKETKKNEVNGLKIDDTKVVQLKDPETIAV